MESLEYYMSLPYKMEIEPDIKNGGYILSFPELQDCVTCADSLEQAVAKAEDCKKAWFTAAIKDGTKIDEPNSMHRFSGQFKLRIPISLHKSLSEHAKAEGVSMNQYCMYLLTMNDKENILRNEMMKAKIIDGMNTPLSECVSENDVDW
jgi:predicted RNase H-like HicB family nuclease